MPLATEERFCMKIEIKNLGPISTFDFDLSKDFNIIFGQNNIGKSYAITAIYLILKNLTRLRSSPIELDYYYLRRRLHGFPVDQSTFLRGDRNLMAQIDSIQEKLIGKIKSSVQEEIDVTSEVERIFKTILNQAIVQELEKSFKNSFSSIENLSNKYSDEKFSIVLVFEDFSFSLTSKDNGLLIENLKVNIPVIVKKIHTNRRLNFAKERITVYFNTKAKDDRSRDLSLLDILFGKLYNGIRREITQVANQIYFLPASRSGLYQALSTFSAVIAELSKSRSFLSTKIELPNISEPVSDYFLYLANISNRKSKEFNEIIKEIEKEILKGEVLFNKDTKKIVFSPSDIKVELDLSFTSSMISEIAPIVAYLKYIISSEVDSPYIIQESRGKKPYNVLFIEEPEAHLHPAIQVKLTELFCKLIESNVKIIITSHSNYMFNKLSNLILEGNVDHNNVGSYLMKMTENGSIVDKLAMKPDRDGIEDQNFADVAEQLYEERIRIYEKLNKDAASASSQ